MAPSCEPSSGSLLARRRRVALSLCLLATIGGLWLAASSMAIFNIRAAVPIMVQTFDPDQQPTNTRDQPLFISPSDDRHRQADRCFSPSSTCLDQYTITRSISSSPQGRDSPSRQPHQRLRCSCLLSSAADGHALEAVLRARFAVSDC
jgi:hypothetical protein